MAAPPSLNPAIDERHQSSDLRGSQTANPHIPESPPGWASSLALEQQQDDARRYKYARLEEPGQIRIMLLKPSNDRNADLVASLETWRLDDLETNSDDLFYTALSYHWGGDSDNHIVYVEGDDKYPLENGALGGPAHESGESENDKERKSLIDSGTESVKAKRLELELKPPNLSAALRELRRRTDQIALWVDAVCINQDDDLEKQYQLSIKWRIYATAGRVCAWLGPLDPNTDSAMQFIDLLSQEDNITSKTSEEYVERWAHVLQLMRCGWFSRRCVIQGIALAKDAAVVCGARQAHWRTFSDVISMIALNFDVIREMFEDPKNMMVFDGNVGSIDDLEPFGAMILVHLLANAFLKHADGRSHEPRYTLEALVALLPTFDASDPRNTIYAVLNIARETCDETLWPQRRKTSNPHPIPQPNYQLGLFEVYRNFVMWVIAESDSLDIICRPWALPPQQLDGGKSAPQESGLPSWIKTVLESPYGRGRGGRKNGDSFVGLPGRRWYNASYSLKAEISFWEGMIDTLDVTGIRLFTVKTSLGLRDGVVNGGALRKLGHEVDAEVVPAVDDRLWRTLVADRGPNGQAPPAWYRGACRRCLVNCTRSDGLDTSSLLARPDVPAMAKQYLRRVRAVCWNRVFLEGDKSGSTSFGIGPPATEAGDVVCILLGCSVPCILRQKEFPHMTEQFYEFIGEAFVLGEMDGEAISRLSDEQLRDKKECFRLV